MKVFIHLVLYIFCKYIEQLLKSDWSMVWNGSTTCQIWDEYGLSNISIKSLNLQRCFSFPVGSIHRSNHALKLCIYQSYFLISLFSSFFLHQHYGLGFLLRNILRYNTNLGSNKFFLFNTNLDKQSLLISLPPSFQSQ